MAAWVPSKSNTRANLATVSSPASLGRGAFGPFPKLRCASVVSKSNVVVLAACGNSHTKLPEVPGCEFIIASSVEDFLAHPRHSQTTVVYCMGGKFLRHLFEEQHLNNVRWVHSFGHGVDHLVPGDGTFVRDILLPRKEVVLTNGKGAYSEPLAEWAIAAALHFSKAFPRIEKNRLDKKWERFGVEMLRGKTIGFLGFGDIGKATARIAKHGFGMRVLALRRDLDKREPDDDLAECIVGFKDRRWLFSKSDVVVCALPSTPESRHFVGSEELSALRDNAVFINVGRGSTVDEKALIVELRSKRIFGALDVFETEPLPQDSPLWSCDNVLISSHCADVTPDFFPRAFNVFVRNIEAFREQRPLVTRVDKSAGY